MVYQPISEHDEEDVVDLRNDMELLIYDDCVRFGFDVIEGRCVEIALDAMDEFAETVKNCKTDHYKFKGRYGTSTFLFESSHPAVHVYSSQQLVASFTDYEKYPLSTIQKHVENERVDWNAEKTARKIVEDYTGATEEVTVVEEELGLVEISVQSEFLNLSKACRLASIDALHRASDPSQRTIENKDEFTEAVRQFLDNINVRLNEDGVEYTLRIDTRPN